ncbi:hypothetical protein GGU10DRAFT_381834 [Lentinula aff. detonsa]|uniref:Uncharacterized protein n=1 Tax=Lentinula aff. detonsa TaxID=2804958 RepID=A0AA38KB76_9AGAR|nr:hypothetical protein GGU10DRAFT_381834 [Lentinula aff. detonsa]
MQSNLPSSDSIPEGHTTYKMPGTTSKPQNNGVKLTLKIKPLKKSTDSTTTATTGKATISTSTLEVDTKEPVNARHAVWTDADLTCLLEFLLLNKAWAGGFDTKTSAHVTPKSKPMWEDLLRSNPAVLPYKYTGWVYWDKMKEILGSPPPAGHHVFCANQKIVAHAVSPIWDIEDSSELQTGSQDTDIGGSPASIADDTNSDIEVQCYACARPIDCWSVQVEWTFDTAIDNILTMLCSPC